MSVAFNYEIVGVIKLTLGLVPDVLLVLGFRI
jgi:hypothetical protein